MSGGRGQRKGDDAGTDRVRAQYEAFPYPERDPRDEAKRLVTGSPGHLVELNHYVFAGRRDFSMPFRVLVAGGGTGDGAIMLAQQLADCGGPAEVLYIDLSETARAIAERRARARRLTNITFRQLSLMELPDSGLGPFDYIDCCGVLHHLEDPTAGLAALVSVLADDGGMGLMVYGELGRTGVYPAQAMLRALAAADDDPAARVALARRLLAQLPPTNWLKRNPFLADHLKGGNAGLYDLLLHARDRAFRVPEVAALAGTAGLAITAFIDPAAYDPGNYLTDPHLIERIRRLDWIDRCAFAESLAGNLRKHVFYAVKASRPGPAVADPADAAAVPVFRDAEAARLVEGVRPGAALTASFDGVNFRFPLPPLAAAVLGRVDGRRSIADIAAEVTAVNPGLDGAALREQWGRVFAALNGIGKLFLRRPAPGA